MQYQEETAPVLWARTNAGNLLGCTYRRFSKFVTEEAPLTAWHQHKLGGNCTVQSICTVPAEGQLSDTLYMCVYDRAAGLYFIEAMKPGAQGTVVPSTSAGTPVGGMYYFEVTISALNGLWYGAPGEFMIGLCNLNFNLSDPSYNSGTDDGFTVNGLMLGKDGNSIGFTNNSYLGNYCLAFGTGYSGGYGIEYAGLAGPPYSYSGDYTYGFMVDATHGYIYWRDVTGNGTWQGVPSGHTIGDGSGISEYAISSFGTTAPFFIGMSACYYDGSNSSNTNPGGQIATLNTGASPFLGNMPSGVSAWDTTGDTSLISEAGSTVAVAGNGLTATWGGSSTIASAVRSSSGVILT